MNAPGQTAPTVSPPASGGERAVGSLAAVELSIVMPCLNEAETVATCVRKARDFLERHGVVGEVIVADNGSTDGSAELASAAGARVIPARERGYGSALHAGIAAARGQFVIMGDADDSYDFSRLEAFLAALREGAELVMGNRFRGGIEPGAMPPLHRFLGNPVLSALGRLFFHSAIGDFHCGLRGFTRAAFDRMDLQTTGMEFASEMVLKAALSGLRVVEVPTTLAVAGRTRAPHLRTWRDGWRHLRFMLLYSPRWLFLYPGLALMLAGCAVGGWLLPGPRRVGAVTLDVHTLLYAALAVLIGAQAVWFAVLARVYAATAGLLPRELRLERAFRWISLEAGLAVGTLLITAGLAGSVYAVWQWREAHFGPLQPSHVLRTIIPSIVALTLGAQILLGSFFLSLLGLRRRGAASP
jgi:glycosyltransferase involved in cell wall biosynthesis